MNHCGVLLTQGMRFTALPPGLANGTQQMEVLDLSASRVSGAPVPVEYGAWTNLTVLRYAQETQSTTANLPCSCASEQLALLMSLPEKIGLPVRTSPSSNDDCKVLYVLHLRYCSHILTCTTNRLEGKLTKNTALLCLFTNIHVSFCELEQDQWED